MFSKESLRAERLRGYSQRLLLHWHFAWVGSQFLRLTLQQMEVDVLERIDPILCSIHYISIVTSPTKVPKLQADSFEFKSGLHVFENKITVIQ